MQIRLTRDEVTPDLVKKLALLKNPQPILRAMGTQLVSLTKRAFRSPSLRQTPWPAKSDGSPSNLIGAASGAGRLMSSIRLGPVTKSTVTIGIEAKYSAIHQLGGVIRAKPGKALVFTIGGRTIFAKQVTIPARPFFPFKEDGSLAAVAVEPVREIMLLATNKALGVAG